MKRSLCIILLLLGLAHCSFAQKKGKKGETPAPSAAENQAAEDKVTQKADPIFNPALILGFNASQVWGDQITGYRKFGANAGAAAYIRLPKHFSISFEILYSMKGSNSGSGERVTIGDTTYDKFKLVMDYIDIPVMFNYHDKKIAIFGAGFSYTSLVRFKELRNGVEHDYGGKIPYATPGLEFVANATFIIAKHYGINLRYNMSVLKINKQPIEYSPAKNGNQQHNYLTMRFMYFFK